MEVVDVAPCEVPDKLAVNAHASTFGGIARKVVDGCRRVKLVSVEVDRDVGRWSILSADYEVRDRAWCGAKAFLFVDAVADSAVVAGEDEFECVVALAPRYGFEGDVFVVAVFSPGAHCDFEAPLKF